MYIYPPDEVIVAIHFNMREKSERHAMGLYGRVDLLMVFRKLYATRPCPTCDRSTMSFSAESLYGMMLWR